MRGKKAKAIRKDIYGDHSHRVREYKTIDGARLNVGFRELYLHVKKHIPKGASFLGGRHSG